MRKTLLFSILALTFASIGMLAIIGLQGTEVLGAIGNVMIAATVAMTSAAFITVYMHMKQKPSPSNKPWFFLAIAFVFFLLGELFWSFSEIVLNELVPIGSISEVGWVFGFVFLIAAVVTLSQQLFMVYGVREYVIMFFTVVAGVAYVWNELQHTGTWINYLQEMYVLFDIVLLGMVLVILLPLFDSHNKFLTVWVLFGTGLIARIIFDFLFALMTHTYGYWTGHPVDVFYYLSYVLFAFAADAKYALLEGVE